MDYGPYPSLANDPLIRTFAAAAAAFVMNAAAQDIHSHLSPVLLSGIQLYRSKSYWHRMDYAVDLYSTADSSFQHFPTDSLRPHPVGPLMASGIDDCMVLPELAVLTNPNCTVANN